MERGKIIMSDRATATGTRRTAVVASVDGGNYRMAEEELEPKSGLLLRQIRGRRIASGQPEETVSLSLISPRGGNMPN